MAYVPVSHTLTTPFTGIRVKALQINQRTPHVDVTEGADTSRKMEKSGFHQSHWRLRGEITATSNAPDWDAVEGKIYTVITGAQKIGSNTANSAVIQGKRSELAWAGADNRIIKFEAWGTWKALASDVFDT